MVKSVTGRPGPEAAKEAGPSHLHHHPLYEHLFLKCRAGFILEESFLSVVRETFNFSLLSGSGLGLSERYPPFFFY